MTFARFRRRGAGPGAPLLLATIAAQIALVARVATLPPPPAAPVEPLGLAAVGVVEPSDGGPPTALAVDGVYPDGARLQITFETDHDAWVSVLWFEGDRVVSLYPSVAGRETGEVAADTTYVVPGASTYLRLTPTPPRGDWLAIVASPRPDPRILSVLEDPAPSAVAALRAALIDAARARTSAAGVAARFLPPAAGRAVAVPWEEVRGHGRLVYGRWVRVAGGKTSS